MNKPINNFAFVLGLFAFAYAIMVVPDIFEIIRQPHTLSTSNDRIGANYVQSFAARDVLSQLRGTLYGSGVLTGLAVMVELLDRIRFILIKTAERSGIIH